MLPPPLELAVLGFRRGRLVLGTERWRVLTLQPPATSKIGINGNASRGIPELTKRSGIIGNHNPLLPLISSPVINGNMTLGRPGLPFALHSSLRGPATAKPAGCKGAASGGGCAAASLAARPAQAVAAPLPCSLSIHAGSPRTLRIARWGSVKVSAACSRTSGDGRRRRRQTRPCHGRG